MSPGTAIDDSPGARRRRPYRPVLEALELLLAPGSVAELRALGRDGRIASGYFDSWEKLADAVEPMDAANEYRGIYVTLNPVAPALLARRANRVENRLGRGEATTADADIVRRRWLPIDVDPVRPSGVSATDEERAAAIATTGAIREALAANGWPAPIVADSGNGGHLLYRVDLPNDGESTDLVKGVLAELDRRFSTDRAKVDTANCNTARIWKLYGTVGRKGDSTTDRPHRRSAIVSTPESPETVSSDLLRALIAESPIEAGRQSVDPAIASVRDPSFDLRRWLDDHGIAIASEKPWQGCTLYALAQCPFSDAHADGAYAIQFPNSAVHAGCKHDSCGGGTQRWPELRARYDPAPSPGAATGPAPPAEDPAVVAEARACLERGDPLAAMVAAFNLDHVGDRVLGQCLALSLASRIVRNSRGLHVMTTEESGKGKSDGYRTMLRQVPPRFALNGSFSDKALYYKKDLAPSSVFFVDDKDMSDSIQEILKEATSSFTEPIHHHTLTADRRPLVCTIPARCVWWVAKKEGTGDDQVLNRMLSVWVNESEEQDRAVLGSAIDREARDADRPPGEHREVRVCRAMWELLHERMIDVSLARFVRRVRFAEVRNRRNPLMFLDMIKSVAAIRFLQRERRDLPGGAVRVYATEADFRTAAAIYAELHGVAGSQGEKLTKREAAVLDLVATAGLEEFTILKLQALTKLSYHQCYRLMSGYASRGESYTGLLEKCPAVSTLAMSVSAPDGRGDGTVRRRMVTYTFDARAFRAWRSGGQVWLAEPGDDDSDGLQHLQQVCSDFAADAANDGDDETGANCGTDDISLRVRDGGSFFAAERESTPPPPGEVGGACAPAICCKQGSKTDESAGITDSSSHDVPLVCSSLLQSAGNSQQRAPPATDPAAVALAEVDPADYAPLPDGARAGPCPVCGGRWVHYAETARARKARGAATARRICRRCFDRARRREQAAVRVLPGVLPVGEIAPVEPGRLGRCSVCDLEAATYRHPGSGTAICASCYENLVREQVEVR